MPKTIPDLGTLLREINERGGGVIHGMIRADNPIDVEARTIELAFSSEEPYERWWGTEILDHSQESVDLSRLNDGASVVYGHDTQRIEHLIGTTNKAWLGEDRIGRAVVRVGTDEDSEKAFTKIRDGLLTKVSVRYQINKMVLVEGGDEEAPVYRVTSWTPIHIAFVADPADFTVGVGRDNRPENDGSRMPPVTTVPKEDRTMDPTTTTPQEIEAANAAGRQAEAARRTEIRKMVPGAARVLGRETAEDLARQFEDNGRSAEEFSRALFDQMGRAQPLAAAPGAVDVPLSNAEQKQYSVLRAVRLAAGFEARGGLEQEISDDIQKHFNRPGGERSIFLPTRVDMSRKLNTAQRDTMVVGTAGVGGNMVPTAHGPLIDLIRNRMMVKKMGARVMSGLTNNLAFPRQATAATLYWTGENPGTAVTASNATIELPTLQPKTAMATTLASRQLLHQATPDAEMFLQDDLSKINAVGLDWAALHGNPASSSNQPTGIASTTGIGDVAGGSTGAAPSYVLVNNVWRTVAIDSADFGKVGFLINAQTCGKLMQTPKVSSTDSRMVIEDFPDAEGFTSISGMRTGVSNQVSSTLTKSSSIGVCSAIFFGNWDDLIIGEFGAIELIVNPYTYATKGLVEITSQMMCDILVRHPQSFGAMLDALST